MRQKYLIQKNDKEGELKITEFANLDREYKISELVKLDKEYFSLLCEERYDRKELKSAIKEGREILISALRTQNMYPIRQYAGKIADSIIALYASKNHYSVEILFDDKELLESTMKATANNAGDLQEIDRLIEVKKQQVSRQKDKPH
ncbi:hypothetical protein ACFLZL_00010 [Thermodesulfobacteriota bacterium]